MYKIQENAMKELQLLSEASLQSKIVEPLMRKIGFQNVQDHSGRNEKGKDIIATRLDNFGEAELISIQIKKLKISGSVSSNNSFSKVLDQVEQALDEPTIDPLNGAKRKPNKCYFITPYPLKASIKNSRYEKYQNLIQRGLVIIDGTRLVDLVMEHIPNVISSVSMELHYRIEASKDANTIHESTKALSLESPLQLENIYVDLSINYGTIKENNSILSSYGKSSVKIWKLKKESDGTSIKHMLRKIPNQRMVLWYPARIKSIESYLKKKTKKLESKEVRDECKNRQLWVEVNISLIANSIGKKYNQNTKILLNTIQNENASSNELTEAFRCCAEWDEYVHLLFSNKDINKQWPMLIDSAEFDKKQSSSIKLSNNQLLNINLPILITGGPGAGKTTLLRKVSSLVNENYNAISILVRLVKIKDLSVSGLIDTCIMTLKDKGYNINSNDEEKFFLEEYKNGKYLLLFDGLDETGEKIEVAIKSLKKLANHHHHLKLPFIVTCRNTIKHSWNDVLKINLLPFTDTQLDEFISKWFTSEPSIKANLINWLEVNSEMKEHARIPLISSLLCSLCEADAELPDTEVDLYERRLELLVGYWESAKNIQPLSRKTQTIYKHLLMSLAFILHKEESRIVTIERLLEICSNYKFGSCFKNSGEVVDDLIMRGLIEFEPEGLSLGHLTFQEFLVARYLAVENDVEKVFKYMSENWWLKSIDFYAAIKKDIKFLIRHIIRQQLLNKNSYERLIELRGYAPMTPISTIISLNKIRNKQKTSRVGL